MATTGSRPPSRRRSRSTTLTASRTATAAAAALLSLLAQQQGAAALELCPPNDSRSTNPCCRPSQRQQPPPPRLHRKRRQRCSSVSSSSQLSLSRCSSSPGPYGIGGGGGGGGGGGPSSAPPLASAETSALSSIASSGDSSASPSASSSTLLRSSSPTLGFASTTAATTSALKQRDRAVLNNRQRRRTTAPLVDSDLLRFLGRQKQLLHRQQHGSEKNIIGEADDESSHGAASVAPSYLPAQRGVMLSDNGDADDTSDVRFVSTAAASSESYDLAARGWTISDLSALSLSSPDGSVEEEEDRPAPSTSTTTTPPPPSSSSVCQQSRDDVNDLGQFQGDQVANLLLSRDKGLDPHLAARAGDAVHSEALRRASRRQIRAFLRARDRQWLVAAGTAADGTDMRTGVPQAAASMYADTADSALESSTSGSHGDGHLQLTVELLMADNATHPYGLTGRDVCEILVHTPSAALMHPFRRSDSGDDEDEVAALPKESTWGERLRSSGGETLRETLDRVMALLTHTLKLRRYDARKVLRSCPGLLTQRGSRNAAQMVTMLTESLSVTSNSLARDKAGLPTLLRRSPSALFRLVAFLASDAVRMPVSLIGPLIRHAKSQELLDAVVPVRPSSTMATDASASASPSLDADLGGDSEAGTIVNGDAKRARSSHCASSDASSSADRRLLIQERRNAANAMYRNMTRTAWTLRNELGTADLGKVIAAYPSVLLLDAESQVLEVAKFLMDDLGIWKDDMARVLQLYPVLLGMEVDKMRAVANYLSNDLEVSSDCLAVIFRSFPKLLALSVEDDMKPVVDFLQTEIGIANVGRFISRLPPVLGYSVDRELRPKWKFLTRVFVDARFEVTRFPAYLSYPLERVIKPRFEYLRRVKRVPTPLLSLDQVLRYGDRDFSAKVARDSDHGQAYARFVEERQRRALATTASATEASTLASATPSSAPIGSFTRKQKSRLPVQQQRP